MPLLEIPATGILSAESTCGTEGSAPEQDRQRFIELDKSWTLPRSLVTEGAQSTCAYFEYNRKLMRWSV